jgi:hypothetical protein
MKIEFPELSLANASWLFLKYNVPPLTVGGTSPPDKSETKKNHLLR